MKDLQNLKVVDHGHSCEILNEAEQVVAVVLGFPDTNIKHAHVMAAAPELLESLTWLLTKVGELNGDISLIGVSKCMDAILKAKGELS